MELDPYLIAYTKLNSEWVKDLNVRVKIIKLVEENLGKKLPNIGFGDKFLAMTPKAQVKKKQKINNSVTLRVFNLQKRELCSH